MPSTTNKSKKVRIFTNQIQINQGIEMAISKENNRKNTTEIQALCVLMIANDTCTRKYIYNTH